MLNDPYSPCPCGSGKKFKWCCQPIHAEVAKIFALDEEGQHEAAVRAMDELVAQHADNPEIHGRKAQLLFQNDKVVEAESALEKAFALFPNYPFGFFLKARFRLSEGEVAGALVLLRKAVEFYDPDATDILAQLHVDIFDCEMKLNHPIAARAAAEMALRLNPASEPLRQGIQSVFGSENSNLPESARKLHAFKSLPATASAERRQAWESVLKSAATGRLVDAIKAFQTQTQADANEPAGWFNLGVCQAWAGNNAAAVKAFERYVSLEPDESQAAQAWAIAEVLRLGQGMEDQADLVHHFVTFALRDPRTFVGFLNDLQTQGRLTGTQVNEEQGVLRCIILEEPGPALTPELAAKQNLRSAADVTLMGNFVNLSSPHREVLDKLVEAMKEKLAGQIVQPNKTSGPARFVDVLTEGIRFPRNAASQEEAEARVREGFEKFYEETWIHRPLKSLGGVPPIDAAGHGLMRKKLKGLLQFVGECVEMAKFPYDINRLARKLGLIEGAAPATSDGQKPDITALGVAELAGLPLETLSSGELDQAFQAALKLDARELAGKFAAQLVSRPPYAERPDRFALHQLLVNQAIGQGNLDSALDHVNDGERDDCENNEGRRRNEYELRRAQVHARRGEFDQAGDVYDRLITRMPTDLNYRVNAAETMLSAKQKDKALKYATEGHAAALKANNRDLEGHFKELMSAAQK